MSWIQKLYETYEACEGQQPDGSQALEPDARISQQLERSPSAPVLVDVAYFETGTEGALGRNFVLFPGWVFIPDEPATGMTANK